MKGDDLDVLHVKASEYGIVLTPDQMGLFRRYLDELWDWNRRTNLTGLGTRERVVIELFLDSLIPGPFLPKEGRMLDVGSGAGLPGLPLKILNPRLRTHLLEANTKKASFLKHVIRLLGLDGIEVIRGRLEEVGSQLDSQGYEVVTARAVVGLKKAISWCAPYLGHGGFLVCFLGREGKADITASRSVLEGSGLTLFKTMPYVLPGRTSKRISVIFRKAPGIGGDAGPGASQ